MATKRIGIVTRIPWELDQQIKDYATKNNIKFADAGREIAKLNNILKGKKVFREIKF